MLRMAARKSGGSRGDIYNWQMGEDVASGPSVRCRFRVCLGDFSVFPNGGFQAGPLPKLTPETVIQLGKPITVHEHARPSGWQR